jgi:hypothetical protein
MVFLLGNRALTFKPILGDNLLIGFRHHWLQSNVDRLAMTFRREVTGIHNLTWVPKLA